MRLPKREPTRGHHHRAARGNSGPCRGPACCGNAPPNPPFPHPTTRKVHRGRGGPAISRAFPVRGGRRSSTRHITILGGSGPKSTRVFFFLFKLRRPMFLAGLPRIEPRPASADPGIVTRELGGAVLLSWIQPISRNGRQAAPDRGLRRHGTPQARHIDWSGTSGLGVLGASTGLRAANSFTR